MTKKEEKINTNDLDSALTNDKNLNAQLSESMAEQTADTITETPVIIPANELDSGIQIPVIEGEIEQVSEPMDIEMCGMIYESLFGMASSLINKESDVILPPARVKSQGALLQRLFEKYNFNNDNMDGIMFLMGCALDYKLIKDSKGSE